MTTPKLIYTFGLLWFFLLFLTGCGDEDTSFYEPSISFTPQAKEVSSRASFINNTHDLDHFIVWGNYDGEKVFTAQRVNKINDSWEYSPGKSWVLSANEYHFSAYLPADAGTPRITNNQLYSIDFNCATQQTDLMMAYTTVPKADFGKTVEMSFKHALAAINFSFKLKEGFTYSHTYKVTGIKWNNVYTQGTFALNSNNTITSSVTGQLGETQTLPFTGTHFTVTTPMDSDFLFVIPQTLASASLTFILEIDGVRKEIVKSVSSIQWESGKRYTYTISIDPFEITVQTTPWEIHKGEIII